MTPQAGFTLAIRSAGLDPRPFAVVVAVCASAAVLSPVGYQTNTMVYGLGGYRFLDYGRLGLPLTFVILLVVTIFLPKFWLL